MKVSKHQRRFCTDFLSNLLLLICGISQNRDEFSESRRISDEERISPPNISSTADEMNDLKTVSLAQMQ